MMTQLKIFAGILAFCTFVSTWNTWADTIAQAPEQNSSDEEANSQLPDPVAVQPPAGKVPDNLVIMGDGEAFSQYAMIADKSKRTLTVWKNQNNKLEFVSAVPMDIGKNGGDKTRINDEKTPEGIYFPQAILEQPEIPYDLYGVRAFTLDYPNFFDKRAKKTGYGIWLHAIPETKSLLRGSRGCVVVRNEIITQLSPMITLKKTPVIIEDEVNYINVNQLQDAEKGIQTWIEKWRTAWASKNIDEYIGFYADDFKAMRMNRDQWRRYKENLNKRYEYINVKISRPVFFTHNDHAILNFLQHYESDSLKDFGRKTLYLRRVGQNDYRILGEEWAPEDGGLLARTHED